MAAVMKAAVLLLWAGLQSFAYAQEKEPVFTYQTDRGVDAKIFLAYDSRDLPDFYFCDLFTPICLEDLCNPIEIRLEWDLLGNFRNYHEVKGKEITKFDHVPFEAADHVKLKEILADRESLLRDYRMEDLVDTTRKIYSSEIDGLTAATSKTFEDKLVAGAIYTCFTLWHVINGEISERILTHTRSLMSDSLKSKMLLSSNVAYQDFVLDGLTPNERGKYLKDLLTLIEREDPFIAIKSIRRLPDHREIEEEAAGLVRNFDKYPLPVRSAIIQYFNSYPCHSGVLLEWTGVLDKVPENQRVSVYGIFEKNRSQLDKNVISQLNSYLKTRKEKLDGHDRKLMLLLN